MHLWPEVTSANYIRPSVGGQFCGFDPGTAPISSQASRPFRQSMQLLLGLLFRRPNLVQYMYIHLCMYDIFRSQVQHLRGWGGPEIR